MIRSTELPCLPGYSFNYNVGQTRFHKSHHFQLLGRGVPYLSEESLPGIGGAPLSGTRQNNYPSVYAKGEVADLPSWLVYDKQTLTFDAYYLENIYEGGLYQNYIVHKCKICFFLEDGTLQVFEKPEENSGVPQGCIIRRQKVRIPGRGNSNEVYEMIDFNIGREIELFGKVFKITSCDLFTRRFLNRLGIPVPDPIGAPQDPYLEFRSKEGQKCKVKQHAMKKLLEMDNRILTFHAYWDDTTTDLGLLHRLKILYFLSDGSIEVKDVTDPERTYTLVKRGKFPKEMEVNLPAPGAEEGVTLLNVLGPTVERSRSMVDPLALGVPDKEYYTDRDLTIGSVLASYGRRFVIVDMDPFTKDYYRIRYGLQDILPLEVPKTKEDIAMERVETLRPATPPHNGFGSYEDSLHNVRHLIPENKVRVFRIDQSREPIGYDSKILRFGAYLLEEDGNIAEGRRFIISYYLMDSTISVFEIPFVNSGRDGGVILRRRKIYIPGQNVYSSKPPKEVPVQEFYLGNTVVLDNFRFHIVDIDEYTMKHMENHPDEFPLSNVRTILNKVREQVREIYNQWTAPFKKDIDHISYSVYRRAMNEALGNKITEHEILALARHFNQSPAIENYNKENLRACIHDDLRRFLYDDFDRLIESFRHFDSKNTGYVSERHAYSTLRGARIPVPPDLLQTVTKMFSHNESGHVGVNYSDLVDFMNYKKFQVPPVSKPSAKGKFGLKTSSQHSNSLVVNVRGIIEELNLEDNCKKGSA